MSAPPVRRPGWRSVSMRRLALLAGLWCGSAGLAGPEPPSPDPDGGPPGPPAVARTPDRPPDRLPPARDPPLPLPNVDRPPRPERPNHKLLSPQLDVPLSDEEFAVRRGLNHVLYRDQRYRLLLEQAQAALARGDALQAAESVLQILHAAEDVFLWDDVSRRPVSARGLAERLIAAMTPAQRSVYERYLSAAADTALAAALDSPRLEEVLHLPQRYPGTTAALRAERCAARLWFDAGRYRESARAWRRLLAEPERISVTPDDYLRAVLAYSRAGDPEAAVLLASVADQTLTLAGETRTLSEWHARMSASGTENTPSFESREEHWLTPAGSPLGGQPRPALLPYHVPLWSSRPGMPLAADAEPPVPGRDPAVDWQLLTAGTMVSSPADQQPAEDSIRQWLQTRLAAGEPTLTALTPLVVSRQVIVREGEGLVARDLFTGRRLWSYRCETPLGGLSAAARETAAAPDAVAFNQNCAENALLATLTSDGERIYLIDHLAESPAPAHSPGLTAAEASAEGAPPRLLVNRLVALPLPTLAVGQSRSLSLPAGSNGQARSLPEAETNQRLHRIEPLWTVGGAPRRAGSGAPLDGHFFLGPPLPVGGRLLVLTEREGEICLVVLQADTGGVLLIQGLALVDRPVSIDRERVRLAFLPAFVDGLVLCPTPSGALVAFDLERRTLQWVAQYRTLDTYSTTGWRGDGRGAGTRLPVQPVVCQGHVLLLPPDSGDLYSWQLTDGTFAWKTPRRGAHQVTVAATDSLLLASTDRLTCLHPLTGERRWERSTGPICGQGLAVGGRFAAPLAGGTVLVVDVATGQSLTGGPEILEVVGQHSDTPLPLLTVSGEHVTAADERSAAQRHVLGNLAATGEWIVSVSPLETAVYVGAEPLRQVLRERSLPSSPPPQSRDSRAALLHSIVQQWSDPQRHLRAAEISLALGDTAGALPFLLRLTAAVVEPAKNREEPPPRLTTETAPALAGLSPWTQRAEQLLRELLHARLGEALAFDAADSADVMSVLDQLASLARTPEDQARWDLARLQAAAQRREMEAFLAAARALSRLPPSLLVPLDVSRTHHLAPAVLIRPAWERLTRELSPQESDALEHAIRAEWDAVAAGDDPQAVERFIRCYDGRAEADLARLLRGEWEWQRGRLLAAESNLLAIDEARRPDGSGNSAECWSAARNLLADVWGGRGLQRESRWARQSLAHSGSAPDRPLEWRWMPRVEEEDRSLTQVAFRPESPSLAIHSTTGPVVTIRLEAFPRDEEPDEDVRPANAESHRITPRDLAALLEHPRELVHDARSSLRILNLGELPQLPPTEAGSAATRGSSPLVELALIHRETARRLGSIAVPSRAREPLLAHQPPVGHFLPLADSAVHGLSLIDGQWLWTVERPSSATGSPRREERLRLGPSGPGFCTVQTPEGLCCLDPLTGLVRWQRSDVPPDSGLYADETAGLYGDEDVLVLLDADLRTCRVLATATGEVLHLRQIPIDPRDARRQRTPLGSRLFFVTGTRDEPRFRLWDARTDHLLLDVPAHPRLCDDRVNRRVVACLTAEHEILVVDVQRGRVLLRHPVPAGLTGQVTGIRVWRDPGHWYVYLAHGLPLTGGPRYENAATEVKLPAMQLHGTLTVYAASTHQPLWTRSLDNRTLLWDPELDVPFLVAVSRIREGLGVSTTGLRLEAIDKRTGALLAERSDVDRVRLVHATHDAAARELALYGENVRLVFGYGPSQPLVTVAEETTTNN
jgi:outer membrane protein assembly factor BamB